MLYDTRELLRNPVTITLIDLSGSPRSLVELAF